MMAEQSRATHTRGAMVPRRCSGICGTAQLNSIGNEFGKPAVQLRCDQTAVSHFEFIATDGEQDTVCERDANGPVEAFGGAHVLNSDPMWSSTG